MNKLLCKCDWKWQISQRDHRPRQVAYSSPRNLLTNYMIWYCAFHSPFNDGKPLAIENVWNFDLELKWNSKILQYNRCSYATRDDGDRRCDKCYMLYSVTGYEMFDGKKWKACAYEAKGCNHAWCPDCVSTLEISNHEANCGWKHAKGTRFIYEIPPIPRKKRKNAIERKEAHWSKEAEN